MNAAMNDHEKIRALLALAAADVLEPGEEKQLMDHLRTCDSCGTELEKWKLLAGGLRRAKLWCRGSLGGVVSGGGYGGEGQNGGHAYQVAQ